MFDHTQRKGERDEISRIDCEVCEVKATISLAICPQNHRDRALPVMDSELESFQ